MGSPSPTIGIGGESVCLEEPNLNKKLDKIFKSKNKQMSTWTKEELEAYEKGRDRFNARQMRPLNIACCVATGVIFAGAMASNFVVLGIGILIMPATFFGMAYISMKTGIATYDDYLKHLSKQNRAH